MTKPLIAPTTPAGEDPHEHSPEEAAAAVDHHGGEDPGEGKHGFHRQVDAPRGEAEEHGAGHHADHGDRQAQPDDIHQREEVRDEDCGDGKERHEDQEAAVVAPRDAQPRRDAARAGDREAAFPHGEPPAGCSRGSSSRSPSPRSTST